MPLSKKQITSHDEDGGEYTQGANQSEDSLHNGVMDEKVVSVVRLARQLVGPFGRAL